MLYTSGVKAWNQPFFLGHVTRFWFCMKTMSGLASVKECHSSNRCRLWSERGRNKRTQPECVLWSHMEKTMIKKKKVPTLVCPFMAICSCPSNNAFSALLWFLWFSLSVTFHQIVALSIQSSDKARVAVRGGRWSNAYLSSEHLLPLKHNIQRPLHSSELSLYSLLQGGDLFLS